MLIIDLIPSFFFFLARVSHGTWSSLNLLDWLAVSTDGVLVFASAVLKL